MNPNNDLYQEYLTYQQSSKKKSNKNPNEIQIKSKFETSFDDDLLNDFEGEIHGDEEIKENERYEEFNMDEERENGMIDKEGNIVLNRQKEKEEKDVFISSIQQQVSKEDEAKYKAIKIQQKEKEEREEMKFKQMKENKNDYYKQIKRMLNDKENPQQAICRLNKEKRIKNR